MTINVRMQSSTNRLKPKITVIGVGGAGGNAVNNMISSQLEGCEFLVCNTDAQALEGNSAAHKIQMGENVTRGLGAGANPEIGRAAAEESIEEILSYLEGSNMVFVTAGMGGGTGTGAAAVIAQAAREQGILTVGVITKPFHFEGSHRMKLAESGITELQKHVDTLIIIPNQNLFRIANEKTTFSDAFRMADEVLQSGVRGVTDLMVMPGLINLDFADIRSVMAEMGKAMMGTGEAEGERRAVEAAEAAISNPLLDDVSMKGARGVLINITGGLDMTLFEVDEAANRIRDEVDPDANIIFGSTFDQTMEGMMRVSVVATGIEAMENVQGRPLTIAGSNVEPQRSMGNTATTATAGFSGIRKSLGNSPVTTATAEQVREQSYNREHYSAGGGIPKSILPSGLPQGHGTMMHGSQVTQTMAESTHAPVMAGGAAQTATPAMSTQPSPTTTVGYAETTTTQTAYAPSQAARKIARDDIPTAPAKTQSYQRVVPPVSQSQPRGVRHGNSFIPPKPVDPRQSSASGDLFAAQEVVRTEAKAPVAEKPVQKKSPSLFERFTMSRKEEAVTAAPVHTDSGLTVEKGGQTDEDELDIPAFLRRQAN